MKSIVFGIFVAVTISGCSTMYTDSARAADGGMYITGSYDGKKAIFYCPKSLNKTDCEKVEVIEK